MRVLSAALTLYYLAASLFVWFNDAELRSYQSAWEWFLLPGIAVVLVVGIRILAARMEDRPGWLNLPDKARFLALPAERQRPVLQHTRSLVEWIALDVTIIMGLIQLGLYYQRGEDGFNAFLVAGLAYALLVSPIVMFVYISRIQSEVTRQTREHAAEENPG